MNYLFLLFEFDCVSRIDLSQFLFALGVVRMSIFCSLVTLIQLYDRSSPMAQNEESIKSQTKSPNSHLPCVTCPDNSISSFDLLNSYRSAAIFLKAAADSQNPRKSMTLPSVSPLSTSAIKQRCPSPPDGDSASSAAAAAASLISRPPCQHSPTTSSKIQAAFVMAMAASSPPSTCPSSSSSGHQGEHGTNDFRSDTQSSLGALFRPPPPTAYETVDGGGNGAGDVGFPPPGSSALPSFVPFTNNSGASPEISASTCLTNAMLLPASIVNVLGQQVSCYCGLCALDPHHSVEVRNDNFFMNQVGFG